MMYLRTSAAVLCLTLAAAAPAFAADAEADATANAAGMVSVDISGVADEIAAELGVDAQKVSDLGSVQAPASVAKAACGDADGAMSQGTSGATAEAESAVKGITAPGTSMPSGASVEGEGDTSGTTTQDESGTASMAQGAGSEGMACDAITSSPALTEIVHTELTAAGQ